MRLIALGAFAVVLAAACAGTAPRGAVPNPVRTAAGCYVVTWIDTTRLARDFPDTFALVPRPARRSEPGEPTRYAVRRTKRHRQRAAAPWGWQVVGDSLIIGDDALHHAVRFAGRVGSRDLEGTAETLWGERIAARLTARRSACLGFSASAT